MYVPFINKIPDNLKDMYRHDFISGIYWGIYGAITFVLGPFVLIKYFNLNNYLVSLIISGPLLGMFFSPMVSELIKYTKKKPIMTFLALLGRGILILLLFPLSNFWLTAIIALGGFISALTFPIYTQVLKLNYTDDFRGRAMGYVRVGISATTIIFSGVIGYVLTYFPYLTRYLFVFGGLCGVLAAVEFNKIYIKEDDLFPNLNFKLFINHFKVKDTYNTVKRILKNNTVFKYFIIFYSVFNLGISLINPLIPIYFNSVLKLNYNIAGIILGVFPFIAGLIIYVIWGKLIDKNSPLKLLSISFFLYAIGTFIFPLYSSLFASSTAIIIFSIVRVGFDILGITAILYFCIPEESGTYMGINLIFAGLIGAFIPYLSIFLLNYISMSIIFFTASILMLISSLLMFFLYKNKKIKLNFDL